MKKTISMLVTAALILALAGCNGDKTSGSSSTGGSEPVSSGGSSTGNSESTGSVSTPDSSSEKSGTPSSSDNSDSAPESTGGSSSESTSVEKPETDPKNQGGEMSGSVLVLDDGRAIDLYGGGYERCRFFCPTTFRIWRAASGIISII